MDNKIILLILFVLLSFSIILYSINQKNTPEKTTQEFYNAWINHEGNPLTDKLYEKTNLVTEEFKNNINNIITNFNHVTYDPILCSQNKPQDLKIVNSNINNDSAQVIVKESFNENEKNITVHLKNIDSQWKINNIECDQPDTSRPEANFQKQGNIVNKEDGLVLIYEEPGKPALTTSLFFTPLSVCMIENGQNVNCELINWQDGNRVEINGVKQGDILEVYSLLLISQEINSFDQCVNKGYEVLYPDCVGCKPYCKTPDGKIFEKPNSTSSCIDRCGNGICEEVVCMAIGCPCSETAQSCPLDCK